MLYVIQKGNQYIRLSDAGKVDTVGLKKATKFTLDEARRTKLKAPAKTRGFEIREQPLKDTKEKKKKTIRKQFSVSERSQVYSKTNGHCGICGEFVPFDSFTIDHIIPISKGGSSTIDNLQCSCLVCNRIKQDILPEDLFDKISAIISYQLKIGGKIEVDSLLKDCIKKKMSLKMSGIKKRGKHKHDK